MKHILLSNADIVSNRKQISLKLSVWRNVITCAKHEGTTTSKLIESLIDKHIKENKYDIEEMFKANIRIKKEVLNDLVDFDLNSIKQITE